MKFRKPENFMEKDNARLQTAQWVLERHLAWIAAAEAKIGAVVTIDTGLLAGLAAAYGASDAKTRTAWTFFIACVAGGAAICALYCAALALKPRVGGPLTSLLFFGRIAQRDRLDYQTEFAAATPEELLNDWTAQIHRNAEIAAEKYKWVALSIRFSFAAAAPWIVAILMFVKP